MTKIVLELTCAVVLGITLAYLWLAARKKDIRRQEGWWYIVAGFSLLFFGMLLDITDNFPALEKYIIIGNTPAQVILEKVVGYLFGFLLLAIGFIKWLPTVIALNRTRRNLQESRDELEEKVAERTDHLNVINKLLKQEIADRKLATAEIRQFKTICERANFGLAIGDLEGNIIYANQACAGMHGFTPEEIMGKTLAVFHNQEQLVRVKELIERLRQGGSFSAEEVWHAGKDGSVFPVLMTGVAIMDDDDKPAFMAATMLDISARKRREVELVRLSSALAGLAEMVIITGLDHRIIYANAATKNILGYSPEEVIDRPAAEFFEGIPGNPPNLAEKMRDEAVGGTWQGELLNRRKDGSFIHVHLTMSLLKDEDGTLVGYVGITWDITQRHHAEEAMKRAYHELKGLKSRLIQAKKLSAIGRLAAGVAHELNSPLDGIMTLLRLSRRQVAEGSKDHEQTIAMLTAAEHMAGIIQDLTSFARETKGAMEKVNLNDVIESTLSFSAYQLTERNITIIKDFSDSLPEIRGDKGQLQQVVLNLIINARDAMSGGGTLRIRTGSSGDNEKVLMEFADTGSGIAEENLDKIFDPFFTTKKTGEGIGLGLSVSYGIVEYHKGEIAVASKPGEGTIFSVTFPV